MQAMQEMKHALERNEFDSDEERREVERRLEELTDQVYRDTDDKSDFEPKLNEKERKIVKSVLGIKKEKGNEAALDFLLEEINDDSSAAIYFIIGNLYAESEQREKAIDFYGVALDKFPSFRRAAKNMGILQVQQNQWGSAQSNFAQVALYGCQRWYCSWPVGAMLHQ